MIFNFQNLRCFIFKATEKENSGGGGGGEPSGSEAAKFRLWVKSKGFHLGPPAGHSLDSDCAGLRTDEGTRDVLYLPTGTDKVRGGEQRRRQMGVCHD